MTEREAIKYCKGMIQRLERPAFMVQYEGAINDIMALEIAISALKKQEQTKEVIPHRNYQYLSDYWCECGWHLGKKGDVKFCADCGRRIKWD